MIHEPGRRPYVPRGFVTTAGALGGNMAPCKCALCLTGHAIDQYRPFAPKDKERLHLEIGHLFRLREEAERIVADVPKRRTRKALRDTLRRWWT